MFRCRPLSLCDFLRHSLCKGISRDLSWEECLLAEAGSDLLAHWHSLHKQILTARLWGRYEKQGLREPSCLTSPGHCTTCVCAVKTPEAYQHEKASVLCAVQTARWKGSLCSQELAAQCEISTGMWVQVRAQGVPGWCGIAPCTHSLALVQFHVAITSWEV